MGYQWKSQYWFVLGAIFFLGLVTYFLTDLVMFIIAAWVLSMMGKPLMNFFLEKLHLKKRSWGTTVASIGTIVVMLGAFVSIFILIIPPVIQQTSNLSKIDYYQVLDKLEEPFESVLQKLRQWGIMEAEGTGKANITTTLQKYFSLQKISTAFTSFISTAGNFLFAVFSTIFILFFFLKEQSLFNDYILSLTPDRYTGNVKRLLDETTVMLRRYFIGIVLEMLGVTFIIWLFLTFLGIQNALLIGFLAGLTNIIPYLGPFIGGLLAVIISVSSYITLPFYPDLTIIIIKVFGSFMVMQWIDNLFMQPYIFSNSVKAHPLEIFMVILIGGKFGGVAGMVLAIPVYTVFRVVARIFFSESKFVQQITKEM